MLILRRAPDRVVIRRFSLSILIAAAGLMLGGCGGGKEGAADALELGGGWPEGAVPNATLRFPWVVIGDDSYLATSQEVYIGPSSYRADPRAVTELTGEGVWIGIIDDFSTRRTAVYRFPALVRQKQVKSGATTGSLTSTSACALPHQWSTTWTHGDVVRQIAGGTRAEQDVPVSLVVPSESTSAVCVAKFYSNLSLALESRLQIRSSRGVAPLASIQNYPVVLGTTANSNQQLGTLLGHLDNVLSDESRAIRVVNLSLGSDIGASSASRASIVEDAIKSFPITSAVDAVITVSAGNSGLPCHQVSLLGCNLIAVAMTQQASTRDSTIVVGALERDGLSERVASYSTFPGFLRDRFLWASGDSDTARQADGRWSQGTSFSAPRVAGAAALLRQKYPGLSSVQIADLLLDSADRDMDQDGHADFEGASLTWGRGKLDLSAALKLAAQRYP